VSKIRKAGSTRARARAVGVVAVVVALVAVASACVNGTANTLARPDEPHVLTGADLPTLVGTSPSRIVAFRHTGVNDTAAWTQIPVQVDERKVVDFGQYPTSNTTAGVNGTVYGTTAIGVTALQYADPTTFVGADTNPAFDSDDELVFMTADAGGTATGGTEPAGVVHGSGVQVRLSEAKGMAFVYLFVSDGSLTPAAGQDYVDYDFTLTSGNYKTTYKRADGPNPETSQVTTANYTIGYDDRWIENEWRITAGGATGANILDGMKSRFALSTCGRSNLTFLEGEGAFVANIDGPVRGIRSYVGANSGPLTQRTHVMYRDREEIRTALRVHPIPSIMDFVDFGTAASGMTYSNSANPAGVTINGATDVVSTAVPTWEQTTGAQGTVTVVGQVNASFVPSGGTLDDVADGFYRDELNSSVDQCWGDPHFIGASGLYFNTAIPNTDPAQGTAAVLDANRVVRFSGPNATNAGAEAFAATLSSPLFRTVTAYAP